MSLVVASLADVTASNFRKLFFKLGYYQLKLAVYRSIFISRQMATKHGH